MESDTFQAEGLRLGLRKLFQSSHFSICTLESLCRNAGVHIPVDLDKVLHSIHCVDWGEMDREFREKVFKRILCLFAGPTFALGAIDDLMTRRPLSLPGPGALPRSGADGPTPYQEVAELVTELVEKNRSKGILRRWLG